jgi:RNA polymerase sigma factor (sigma-70 family)
VRNWTTVSDAELLSQAGSHPDAFACFYDRYERAIVGYFMRRTGSPEESADLTGEVFAAALTGAARYRTGGPTAAAWLFTIAHNILLKSVRKGRVEQAARRNAGIAAHLELSRASRERIEATVASDGWVDDLLAQLPNDQQDAVRAYVVEDRSYGEIAARHGTSEAVIRKRVSRGLATLRRDQRRTI